MTQASPTHRQDCLTRLIGAMATAIADGPGLTDADPSIRFQIACEMIRDLGPRDMVETMFAGHAVMLHALLTHGVRVTNQPEAQIKRRPDVVALNKAFHLNLDRLARRQSARPEPLGDTAPIAPAASPPDNAPAPAEQTANPATPHQNPAGVAQPAPEAQSNTPMPAAQTGSPAQADEATSTPRPPTLNRAQRRQAAWAARKQRKNQLAPGATAPSSAAS